jgi:peptide/bleomycin uptake transporter
MNSWYGDFYNLIQEAVKGPGNVTADQFYTELATVFTILVPNILLLAMFSYFVSHYIFRWRTAMNDFYMSHWQKLRHVEGASQRVQEDTMRFGSTVEGLGSSLVSAVMTLLAFLPLLWTLSEEITELPLVGSVDGSMVFVALLSSIFGTVLLAAVGYRLPGLEFNNQLVEAAYRKELVYGEDSAERADPPTVSTLFKNVRKNYFKLYFNYLYFNLFRYAYLQGANLVPYVALVPSLAAATISFGLFQQIMQAFGRVENSFQYLVNAWPTIVELMSVYKRLMAFESAIGNGGVNPAEPVLEM